jgi:hypothetical protein
MEQLDVIGYIHKYYNEVIELQLKEEDKLEVETLSGDTMENVLKSTVEDYGEDFIFLIMYGNKVSGIFGVVPDKENDKIGVGIFLTDDKIKYYAKNLIRNSKIAVEYFLERYDVIYNYCPKSYKKSLKWLEKSCNATIEKQEYNINGEIFKRFHIIKKER